MARQRRRGSAPAALQGSYRSIKAPRKSGHKNNFEIQLVPVLNPRVLYYIGQLSNHELFFEIEELKGLTINEPLLDLCVGLLSDQNFISDKVRTIPVTEIADLEDHIETAWSQLPSKMNFYSGLIDVDVTEGSDASSSISINWILYNIIWADNDQRCPLFWENYWSEFHNGYLPQHKDTKIQADKFLKTIFFKSFVKRHPNFMSLKYCNVRSAVLLCGLYQNARHLSAPYSDLVQKRRNSQNNTDLTPLQQINQDFTLSHLTQEEFWESFGFNKKKIKTEIIESMFNTMILHWEEDSGILDEFMIRFPMGRLFRQIEDGRFAKIMDFFRDNLPTSKYRKLSRELFKNFMDEFLEFNKAYDEYINERDNPDYCIEQEDDFEFFSRYNFNLNERFEEIAYNFMIVILPLRESDGSVVPHSEQLDVLFGMYADYARLGISEDLSFVTTDSKVGIIRQFTHDKNGKVTRRQTVMKKKSLYLARVIVTILSALLENRPRYAMGLPNEYFIKFVKIMADWKELFSSDCPQLFRHYYTECLLRRSGNFPKPQKKNKVPKIPMQKNVKISKKYKNCRVNLRKSVRTSMRLRRV